ncbi:uncharacterized protein B0H18DRAFT_1021119 [Fomitopsis serialis]|uniref:uncharacterized protein n=1 Tax=Fomitopsis serialis TaxID=139415 RepID=UPI0020085027|nr:uncharacterized protein B0H18DRAFT_1021119 [Neoantrodia serialis]KAH9921447.1 hypothetical protein B0H18DRAFT_1021119 [Neoantrodia serialis]
MADSAPALQLKDEGNSLFASGEYYSAWLKYGQAISHDDQNAILYANRAAALIHLEMFPEAKSDAQKATELDPTYAKGWGRLAAACKGLREYEKSAEYYKKAIASMPTRKQDLTAAILKQKEQWEVAMKTAQDHAAKVSAETREMRSNWPPDRAKAMKDELQARLPESASSSAWVLLRASEFWDRGIFTLTQFRQQPTIRGIGVFVCQDVVACLTNAILVDDRVFNIRTPQLADKWPLQVAMEERVTGAWSDDVPAQQVKREALIRQQQGGWDSVRRSIDTTIRVRIMRGLTHYNAALELLEWGRTGPWKDVPREDKGEIFELHWMRGLRRLRLEALRVASSCKITDLTPQSPIAPLEALYEEAQSIIREMPEIGQAAFPGGHQDYGDVRGFLSAFGVYPKAYALADVGFYHENMACRNMENNSAAALNHFSESQGAWYQAAMLFPRDDEQHIWYLHLALHGLKMCVGTRFRVALRIMEQLRQDVPEARKIWEYSFDTKDAGRGRVMRQLIEKDLQFERKMKKDIRGRKFTPDSVIPPKYFPN